MVKFRDFEPRGRASIPFARKSIAPLTQATLEVMPTRRYTVVVADRASGVLRNVTVSARTIGLAIAGMMALPVLMGLGAKWSAGTEIDQLRSSNAMFICVRAALGTRRGQGGSRCPYR